MAADSIEGFWRLARKASFHFADDSTREWSLGRNAESAAIAMLRRNPDWLPEVRENWSELWSLPRNLDETES